MASEFFISRQLKRKIQKDIKKREQIEEKLNKAENEISDDLDEFYNQTDDLTVLSTLKHYEEHSSQKKQILVEEIRHRYNNRNLYVEDVLTLTDWYEKMCNYHNNEL